MMNKRFYQHVDNMGVKNSKVKIKKKTGVFNFQIS